MPIDVMEIVKIVKKVKPLFFVEDKRKNISEKGITDFVTEVDYAVQRYLRERLDKRYPDIQLMSEEKSNQDIDFSKPLWILDPVDGTTNLIHDFRHSAVSLALCIDHEIAAAVIYLPFSDEVFHACKGQGAFLNGLPIHVSKTDMLQNSLISLGTNPYDRSFTNEDFTLFKNIFMQCRDIRRLGSAAMELAYVACGRLDAYIERGLKSWDYAAGGLLIKEAGGTITDYRGVEIDIEYTHNILSGNSKINDCLIQNIKDS